MGIVQLIFCKCIRKLSNFDSCFFFYNIVYKGCRWYHFQYIFKMEDLISSNFLLMKCMFVSLDCEGLPSTSHVLLVFFVTGA